MLAGCVDGKDRFFTSDPNLRSRVAHQLDFPDHDAAEPMRIAEFMLEGRIYRLRPDARDASARYLDARLRQAVRLLEERGRAVTAEDLMTIGPEEILASRVPATGGAGRGTAA